MARSEDTATPSVAIKTPAATSLASVLIVLTVIAAVATIILTGVAFWLSYEHLHDVADSHGLGHSSSRAWAWPGTVDLFIVIGEVLILRASLQRRVDPWAIGLTVAGSGGSIALNVAGVGTDAAPMDYVVAAVPPVAALLAFGALMRQLHGALAARVATPATPVVAPTPPPAAPTVAPSLPKMAVAAPPVADPEVRGELLTTDEVAERRNVKPVTVRSWVNRGKLTPVATDPATGAHLFATADVAALQEEASR